MELVQDPKGKVIDVTDKDGSYLAPCSLKRAQKLVNRDCAIWEDDSRIRLLINNNDRKILRKEIIAEANRVCYICGAKIPDNEYPTLDHVQPKAGLLGRDIKSNLKCCCKRCNDNKSNTPWDIYIEKIKSNREDYPWITDDRLEVLKAFVLALSSQ